MGKVLVVKFYGEVGETTDKEKVLKLVRDMRVKF